MLIQESSYKVLAIVAELICIQDLKWKAYKIYLLLLLHLHPFTKTLLLLVQEFRKQWMQRRVMFVHMTQERERSFGSFIPFLIPVNQVMKHGKIPMRTKW